jgi:hypothetical protein
MADFHLWRHAHGVPADDMRGTVHEEANYATGWILSGVATLLVVLAVWQLGF